MVTHPLPDISSESLSPGHIGRKRTMTAVLLLLASAAATRPAAGAACDDSLKASFRPDADTSVTLVRSFKKGDDLNLDGTPTRVVAANPVCVVKLNVGPGHPGPADAPSTSDGIGIEIWLPSPENWNHRVHVVGGGGFSGESSVSSLTKLAGVTPIGQLQVAQIAGEEGSVSAFTDTGHISRGPYGAADGAFAMNPDGSINSALWKDFARRAIHEMAVKTKALATLYYAQAPKFSYWDGCSTGGRQAHMEAQANPEDFDGILGGDPAMNWSRFITSELYPQIVMQRDLGGILAPAQLTLVSSAAVSACDSALNGQHDGYISDPGACNYDPTRDRTVLCKAGGGTNDTPSCVTSAQALAINKIWYGQTADGSVPDPKQDNGHSGKLSGKQLWFGPSRGTTLGGGDPRVPTLAASMNGQPFPFLIALDVLALELQNPRLSGPTFHNASGNGENGWKSLSYADLAEARAKGIALQKAFEDIDTANPDLTRFRDRKGKMIVYHGLADQLIPAEGTTVYYRSVAARMGGLDKVQDFYRYYQIPGMGHCLGTGSVDGISGISPAAAPPLPAPHQFFSALIDWVEQGKAPQDIVVQNASGTNSRPLCVYPKTIAYKGAGDVMAASSYLCK